MKSDPTDKASPGYVQVVQEGKMQIRKSIAKVIKKTRRHREMIGNPIVSPGSPADVVIKNMGDDQCLENICGNVANRLNGDWPDGGEF